MSRKTCTRFFVTRVCVRVSYACARKIGAELQIIALQSMLGATTYTCKVLSESVNPPRLIKGDQAQMQEGKAEEEEGKEEEGEGAEEKEEEVNVILDHLAERHIGSRLEHHQQVHPGAHS